MQITIYTTVNCPHCRELKTYLSEHHLPYVERNINTDLGARMDLIKRKIMSVPTIFIDQQVLVGFNQAKLEEALRK